MDTIEDRPFFSICIPAYNRSKHLPALLDSICHQNFKDFEITVCEDHSRERKEISEIIYSYKDKYQIKINYFENEKNLGYDANIRNLIQKANGRYCFFMGNDDSMCAGALKSAAGCINRYDNIGMILKSYAWFDGTPDNINQEVRYFSEEKLLMAGKQAISICFRRAGVISGFIINRDAAYSCATSKFDGSLYYQMHLTGNVLSRMNAVYTPVIMVHCRNGEPPEFGNSENEKGKYIPGTYTPQARLNMLTGVLKIAKDLDESTGLNVFDDIRRDYANYFYPYIKDQLRLPLRQYFNLYRGFSRLGFCSYPMFHMYFFVCYLLGEPKFDKLTAIIRKTLKRSPHFGISTSD